MILLRGDDLVARRLDVGAGAFVAAAHRRELDLGVGDRRIGLHHRDAVRIGIDAE